MGIFDFLKPKGADSTKYIVKDERKAECPYCHKALEKVPGKKTKCPNCGEFMFVRTRPKDNARMVVTKLEADKIEEEWSILNGTHDIFLAEKGEAEREDEMFREKFGNDAPMDDVQYKTFIREEKKRKIISERKRAGLNTLLGYEKSGVVHKVEILATKDSCSYCKSQEGKIYSVEFAIKNNLLPCEACNHEIGFCRCAYLPVIEP